MNLKSANIIINYIVETTFSKLERRAEMLSKV